MGQKINPISLRIHIVKPWTARWFFARQGAVLRAGKYPYAKFLEEDETIRRIIRKKILQAGIAGIDIERTSNNLKIIVKAARPGFVIGQGGKGIEELTKMIEKGVRALREKKPSGKGSHISVNVEELKRSEISAPYVAQQIAWDFERRLPFRRVIKKYLEQIVQNREAKGGKITVAGRLGGAEIARHETLHQGPMPLQTLRANIDYGYATAFTTYGTIGVKVWIYKGQVFASRNGRDKRDDKKTQ